MQQGQDTFMFSVDGLDILAVPSNLNATYLFTWDAKQNNFNLHQVLTGAGFGRYMEDWCNYAIFRTVPVQCSDSSGD